MGEESVDWGFQGEGGGEGLNNGVKLHNMYVKWDRFTGNDVLGKTSTFATFL